MLTPVYRQHSDKRYSSILSHRLVALIAPFALTLWQHSRADRMTLTLPMHSKL